jgi:hypothetical protein
LLAQNGTALQRLIRERHPGFRPLTRCSDTRLGVQGQTVACDFQKVFKMHDRLYIGLAGLASDVQTL